MSFFDVYFSEPDLFTTHKDRISLSVNARRRLRQFSSHDERREEFGFQLGKQVTLDSSVFVGYTYAEIKVSDLDRGGEPKLGNPQVVPDTLLEQKGTNDLSNIRFGYRYRQVDNRVNPKNGTSFSLTNQVYDDAIVSDYDFVKSEFRFDWYDEFNEDEPGVSDRYHLGLRAGVAAPYGDTDDVPYSERYFLGGQRLMRGFDFRGVGPHFRRYALGGETMLYGTLEYKRPLVTTTQPGTYQRDRDVHHGGVFLDTGILDPDAFELDINELRASAGLPVRHHRPAPHHVQLRLAAPWRRAGTTSRCWASTSGSDPRRSPGERSRRRLPRLTSPLPGDRDRGPRLTKGRGPVRAVGRPEEHDSMLRSPMITRHRSRARLELCGATLEGDGAQRIVGPASLSARPESEHVSFLANPRYGPQLDDTRAAAVLIPEDLETVDRDDLALLRCADPESRVHATSSEPSAPIR